MEGVGHPQFARDIYTEPKPDLAIPEFDDKDVKIFI
jgi:hypothetical protein